MSMIVVVFYAFHVSSQNERWSGMDDFTHRPVAPRTSVLLFCLSLESGRHMPLPAFSEGSVVHSCCNTLPPCLPAFQQQHTNQHCNVRDLNYSPALTYLQGVWELGVEQISLQGKWQPCGYSNHFETSVQSALPLPLSSPFLLHLFLFPCCFVWSAWLWWWWKVLNGVGIALQPVGRLCELRETNRCLSSLRTHTQPVLHFYWDKHTCMYTFGQLANVYTLWLIAEREREREVWRLALNGCHQSDVVRWNFLP